MEPASFNLRGNSRRSVPQIEVGAAHAPPFEPFEGTRPSVDPNVHGLCSADGVEGCDPLEGMAEPVMTGPVTDVFLRSPDLISLRKEDLRAPAAAVGRTAIEEVECESSGSSSEDAKASESGVERPNLILSALIAVGPKPERLTVLAAMLEFRVPKVIVKRFVGVVGQVEVSCWERL